jgi:hypothetical protein
MLAAEAELLTGTFWLAGAGRGDGQARATSSLWPRVAETRAARGYARAGRLVTERDSGSPQVM